MSYIKVIRTDASLGGTRYLGMRVVDTEWFAFIDSDVEILSVMGTGFGMPPSLVVSSSFRNTAGRLLAFTRPRISGVLKEW